MPDIVVVDDETIFRRGLRSMIGDWDAEWNVVGDAKDGYEALELIERLRPQVVLTDIRMPRMDGLQLQKIVREKLPRVRCVVVSGYEDFAYVQQSMRHGAVDYLMKPVERSELGQALDRLKEELRSANEGAAPPPSPAGEEGRIRYQIGMQLAASLLRGCLHQYDLDALARLGVHFHEPYFNCMVVKLDKESVDKERYRQADPSLFQLYIQQFVQEMFTHRATTGFSFVFSDTEVVAIVNAADVDRAQRRMVEAAESVRRQIKSLSNLTVTIGVGNAVKGFESVHEAFREAEIALLYRLVVGGDKVLEYRNTAKEAEDARPGGKKWSWEALERAIDEGRTGEIEERVAVAVRELCAQASAPEVVHQQICKLFLQYYERSEELGMTERWLGGKDIRSLLLDICSMSSETELEERCQALLSRLTEAIASGNRKPEQDPVKTATKYMERHYGEPLTLKDVADQVFLNAAYFSTLFKQKTGLSFIEKLTDIRIREARKLLASTEDKMASIAERTGFANIRHFNRVFKNETGQTPKDYRDAVRSRGGGEG